MEQCCSYQSISPDVRLLLGNMSTYLFREGAVPLGALLLFFPVSGADGSLGLIRPAPLFDRSMAAAAVSTGGGRSILRRLACADDPAATPV